MSAGKGDSPRNCFSETYRDNYDEIFRKKLLDGEKKTNKPIDRDDKDEDYKSRPAGRTRQGSDAA